MTAMQEKIAALPKPPPLPIECFRSDEREWWYELNLKSALARLALAREMLEMVAYAYPEGNDCRCGIIDDVDALLKELEEPK